MPNVNALLEVLHDKRLQLPAIENPEQAAGQLQVFLEQWQKWNPKINLTSEQQVTAIIQKHIFDSLHYARAVKDPVGRVMDIGSGAGFPGIPLKAIFPRLNLVLVESQRKRANFLRNCVRALGLQNAVVLNQRAEEVETIWQEKFDLVVFRGVGEISQCLKLAAPFLKMGGQVAMKKDPEAELSEPVSSPGFCLESENEIAVEGITGIASKLMIFEKRST